MASKNEYDKLKKKFPEMDLTYALKLKKRRGDSLAKTEAGRKRAKAYVARKKREQSKRRK